MTALVQLAFLLLAANFWHQVHAQWEPDYFEKPPATGLGNVAFSQDDINKFVVTTTFDENVDGVVMLAIMTYKGDRPPTVVITEGQEEKLGIALRQDDTLDKRWVVEVSMKQDFESLSKQYLAEFQVPGSTITGIFTISVRNLNDNKPFFDVTNVGCGNILENFKGDTTCTYTLRDDDGILAADARISVEPSSLFGLTAVAQSGTSVTVKLMVIGELDYETSQLHVITLQASDGLNNAEAQSVILRIDDVADSLPVWLKPPPPVLVLDEETESDTPFSARDGDSGSSASALTFELIEGDSNIFNVTTNIDGNSGNLHVNAIDRDTGITEFRIKIQAKENGDPASLVVQEVQVIINDKNDNIPKITPGTLEAEVMEGHVGNIDFGEIKVVDPDVGTGGQFKVELEDTALFEWKSAFMIIPDSGYQDTTFTIAVSDPAKLNYEDENWRLITLMLKVTEIADETHSVSVPVTITVENRNDERPQFDQPEYSASVPETMEVGEEILIITATDADPDEKITYKILTATTAVKIDADTGNLTVARKNPFDFELQPNIIIQVEAKDIANQTSIVQVTLTVIDENDTPPSFVNLPSDQLSVKEHVAPGTLVTDEITALDPDEDAMLEFSINWSKSYATNKGVRVPDTTKFVNCLAVTTEYIGNDKGDAKALLTTADVPFDWEVFDTLYVSLAITDSDQLDNNVREALLTVTVENINDNDPIFDPNTVGPKSVSENTPEDRLIGYVVATDPDLMDVVTYEIKSDGPSPLEWVTINDKGELKTTAETIDMEMFNVLTYTVIAKDSARQKEATITINVVDINDETPVFDPTDGPIEIDENSPDDTLIATVSATDADDSDEFSTNLNYALNPDYPDLRNYFAVDSKTGVVTVKKRVGYELDRDQEPFGVYSIELIVRDNFPSRPGTDSLQNRTRLDLTLKDLNDEKPTFLEPSGKIEAQENIAPGAIIYAGVSAPDKDEPGTPFSTVTYEIVKILPAISGDPLFVVETLNNNANIKSGRDLRGFYGEYAVTIKATDGGGEFNEKDFTVTILDVNDNEPVFTFPAAENFQIRVSVNQTVGANLNDENDQTLQDIVATDLDDINNGNGQIEFSIQGVEALKYLDIAPGSANKAKLKVREAFPAEGLKIFPLAILAKDKGVDSKQKLINGQIFIINQSEAPPIFASGGDQIVEWKENDPAVKKELPKATDVNNDNMAPENWQLIYYHIIEGDTGNIFAITYEVVENENVPTIGIRDTTGPGLDSDDGPTQYVLKVIAANTNTPPADIKDERSVITVTINVQDVPDSLPVFAEALYVGGIAPTDVTGVEVLRITASDSDQNDPTNYRIVPESIEASEDYLQDVMDTAFEIDPSSGSLRTNFAPQEFMKGYFSFEVEASDSVGNKAKTKAQIYIINASNRVQFLFVNEIDEINAERDFIDQIFTENLGYECAIDYVGPTNTKANDSVAAVRTHFVDSIENLPVEGSLIEAAAANIDTLTEMRRALGTRLLNLYDVTSNRVPEEDNLAAVLTTTLIVVSIVLGSLVVILLVAFVVKTRGLNKRLEALSTTRFGSQESGLNRVAMNVPNTNKHAIEGSNPVWNEDVPNYDNNSQGSGDSDLIGIEDMPEFGYKENQGFQSSYGDFYGGASPDTDTTLNNDNPDLPATYL